MPARIRLIAAGAAVLLVVGWWAWPAIARDPDRLDVLIVGDGQVSEASEPLQRRIRELGMSVELWEADPCTSAQQIADRIDDDDPAIVVVSTSDPAACGTALWAEVRGAAGPRRLIALVQPGRNDPAVPAVIGAAGIEVADPTRLLGAASADGPPPTRIGCQWWDDCDPDGQVEIRDTTGALTPAGGERLARTLAGVIP